MTSLQRPMMIGKIHRATVTQADLHYVGSITVDADLLEAADLVPGPAGRRRRRHQRRAADHLRHPRRAGLRQVCINGAAAHLVHPGDIVIIIAYGMLADAEARHVPAARRVRRRGQPHRRGLATSPATCPTGYGLEPSGLADRAVPARRPGADGAGRA